MTTQDLKEGFLAEHRRDKKLTIVNYSMIGVLALVIIGLVIYFWDFVAAVFQGSGDIFEGEYGWYYKFAFAALAVGYIIFIVSRVNTLNKRPQKIDELLASIDQNKLASNIDESVQYRIVLYLGKITVNLCPVNYVSVLLAGDSKIYNLPLHASYVPDLKTALSGVNVSEIEDAWNDLYVEDEQQENGTQEATPIKTVDEFKKYISEELSDKIEEIDNSRKSTRRMTMICLAVGVIAVLAFIGYTQYSALTGGFTGLDMKSLLPFMIGGVVLFYIAYFVFFRPKQTKAVAEGQMDSVMASSDFAFKTELFGKILNFASPDAKYVMHGHIGLPEFLESGMFRSENYHYSIDGNDLVIGRHSGVPYQFCDLTVLRKRGFKGKDENDDCVFYGQFFVARFNKLFSSPVYIQARNGIAGAFFNNSIGNYTDFQGEKVELEDPEFMKMFNVYASDQIEARYILTASLMERIKELAKRTKGEYYISFRNNKITVLNNSGKNNFEMKMSKSLMKNDNQVVVDFYQDICNQFAVIDDLKLNVKIWK